MTATPPQVQDLVDRLKAAGWQAGTGPSTAAGDVFIVTALRGTPPREMEHARAVYHVTEGRARFYRATLGARPFSARARFLKAAGA